MVSYDIYKNRIQKLAAVKNFIVRFRILIICVTAAILALTSAFLIMKGMVVGGIVLPENITYGDSFEPEGGKALFSSVFFEYAPASAKASADADSKSCAKEELGERTQWTDVKPDKAGNYLIRTVTFKSFGIIGYGTPVEFTIAPKPVEFLILDEHVLYGTNPDEYVFKLVGDDKLIATGLKYDFAGFEATITNVCANASSVKVVDKDGNDVTYCYNIITPEKEIKLVEREITVTPVSADFIYDGSPVGYESLADDTTLKMLGEGDDIVIETVIKNSDGEEVDGTPVEAGAYTAEVSSVKIFKGQTDVTERYGITLKTSKIDVAKRQINIATHSAQREYDGTPLKERGFTVTGIAEGSGHTAISADRDVTVTYVGKAENAYTYGIFDGEGNEVTHNYVISYDYGEISVVKRQITLTTPFAEKVYDGTPLSLATGYEFTTLAEGDKEIILSSADRIIAGESLNEFVYSISNAEGIDVTQNYSVKEAWGILKVSLRPLNITTGSGTKTYDGEAMYGNEVTEGLNFDNIVTGSEYKPYNITPITDAGSVTNGTKYRIFFGEEETTSNYLITYTEGLLTVNKKSLTITTGSGEKEYDGAPLLGSDATEGLTFAGIADGEYGIADNICSVTNVWWNDKEAGTVENVTTYKIFRADKETTENYSINYDFAGTLKITPRPLTVTTGSAEREYNGQPFVYTDGATADELVADHKLEADESRSEQFASVTNVYDGEVDNIVYYIVTDAEGNDVSANYAIEYNSDCGKISVYKREITVTSATADWVYDGDFHYNSDVDVKHNATDGNEAALVLNHKINVLSYTSVKNVSDTRQHNNVIECIVTDAKNPESMQTNDNYSITLVYGTLTISARPLVITTGSGEKIYDGTPLKGDAADKGLTFDGIVDGENYAAFNVAEITDVIYEVLNDARKELPLDNTTEYKIYSGEEETTPNYAIEYVYGKLTILFRPLLITTGSAKKEYDGEPIYGHSEKAVPEFDNLAESDVFDVYYNYSITEVQSDEKFTINRTLYSIYSMTDVRETTQNYDVTYVYGTLTITPREITIETGSQNWEYDGEVHQKLDGWKADRLLDTHTIVPDETRKDEFAWVAEVKDEPTENIVYYIVKNSEGKDISYNYNIDYADWGKISVYARTITVTTADKDWEYDGVAHQKLDGAKADRLLEEPPYIHKLVPDETRKDEFARVTEVKDELTENIVYYIVENSDGEDISYNYAIEYEWGKIYITPREITVTTADKDWEYDGEAHQKLDGWKADRLLEYQPFLHTLIPDETRKDEFAWVTEVKDELTENIVYYIVQNSDGKDISYNYAIKYKYGKISISPRKIAVVTGTGDKVYDGKAYQKLDGFTVDRLLTDRPYLHRLVPDETRKDEFSSVTYVTEGKIANVVYYAVYDGADKDISYNYEIDYSNKGTIHITPRPIVITTGTAEKVYDGTALKGSDATDGLDFGDKVSTEKAFADENNITEITYVLYETVDGERKELSVKNETKYKIYSDESKEFETTENYLISYAEECGTLKITFRPLEITTLTAEKVYDGEPLKGNDTLRGTPVFSTLADGETAVETEESITQITDVLWVDGEVSSVENQTKYRIFRADKETTENYAITYPNNGRLTINPRPLEITTLTAEKVYDGTPLKGDDMERATVKPAFNTLADGEEARVDFVADITDVLWVDGEVSSKVNNTTYRVFKGDKETTANYTIAYRNGNLKINPRPLAITTLTAEKEYDGTPLKGDDIERATVKPAFNSLADEEEARVDFVADITDVLWKDGAVVSKENNTTYKVFRGDKDTTANYIITYPNKGTLKITQRKLTVTTGDDTKVYDGEKLYKLDEYEADRLLPEHEIILDKAKETQFAYALNTFDGEDGIVKNQLYFKVRITDGSDEELNATINGNYIIVKYILGELTITPRPIVITTGSAEKVYDGTALKGSDATDGLDFGDKVSTEKAFADENNITEITYVLYETVDGVRKELSVKNQTKYKIYSDESKQFETTENYLISYAEECGTLKINFRPLEITTLTAEKVYDGEPLKGDDFERATVKPSFSTLANDETVKSDFVESITDVLWENETVGSIENCTTYKVFKGDKETTENYTITYPNNGRLTINPRPLEITTLTAEKEYDGEPLKGDDLERATVKPTFSTLAKDERAVVIEESVTQVTNVVWKDGEVSFVQNETQYKVFKGDKETTANYKITYPVKGTLKIRQRELTVKTGNDTRDYNGEKLYKLDGFAADRLLTGHEVILDIDRAAEFAFALNVKDGKVKNQLYFKVQIAGEDNVKLNEIINGNYKIECNPGILEVTPKGIEVELNTLGNLIYGEQFNGYPAGADNYANPQTAGLVEGETLSVAVIYKNSKGDAVAIPKDADEYTVCLNLSGCTIAGGQKDINNYTVTKVKETKFTIEKKELTVRLTQLNESNNGKIYDGVAYNFLLNEPHFTSTQTAYGEILSIAVTYNDKAEQPVNAGTYVIALDVANCKINGETGETNANNNYRIIDESQEVVYTITPRVLTVTIQDVTREYNGVAYSCETDGHKIIVQNSLDGKPFDSHLISLGADGKSAMYAGTYDIVLGEWSVENDIKSNYLLDVTDGVLTISKRIITVKVNDKTGENGVEYTGEDFDERLLSVNSYRADGDFGFVNGDADKITPEYGFSPANPVEIGDYTVSASYENQKFITDNYDITYETGTLEIVKRFVTVEVNNIESPDYTGNAFDFGELSYKHYHKDKPLEQGFLNGDEANYVITYTVEGYTPGKGINAGSYTVTVQFTPKAGFSEKYVIDYKENTLTVTPRKIYASPIVPDEERILVYTKQMPSTANYGYEAKRADGGQAFVVKDGVSDLKYVVSAVYDFDNAPLNVGEYNVFVEDFAFSDEVTKNNYELIVNQNDFVTIEITRARLIIAPKSKAVLYNGATLTLNPEDVIILNDNLKAGDFVTAEFDYEELDPASRSARVNIVSYQIKDANGADMSGNYETYYEYDRSIDFLKELGSSSFRGRLTWEKRSVTVKVNAPEIKEFEFSGETIYIEADESELFDYNGGYVDAGSSSESKTGLITGHYFEVYSTRVGKKPGEYANWLKLRVYDADGNNVSWAYDINYDTTDAVVKIV